MLSECSPPVFHLDVDEGEGGPRRDVEDAVGESAPRHDGGAGTGRHDRHLAGSDIEVAGKDKVAAAASIGKLVANIRTGTPEIKATALRVLGKAGDAALEQVALIAEQAKDPDSIVRTLCDALPTSRAGRS